MDVFEIILLGILQGLTEFLPVSSSGHLVLFQHYLGISQPGITLEVMLHLGTLVSVIWVFKKDIIILLTGIKKSKERKIIWLLILGMVPTGIMGIIISRSLADSFEDPLSTGCMLLVTGFILFILIKLPQGNKNAQLVSWKDALWVGAFQGIAVIPGISRSGITITGALWRGFSREMAIKYSFLLSIPAILAAASWELFKLYPAGIMDFFAVEYLLALVAAFIAGVIAIKSFIIMLNQGNFRYFAYYCFVLGTLVIALEVF